jgi:hypothetical protein
MSFVESFKMFDCNGNLPSGIGIQMAEIDEINELPEPDDLPPADEDSAEYRAGFQAGKQGKPSDRNTVDWHRGWADAQE